jgi:hypothetical protein
VICRSFEQFRSPVTTSAVRAISSRHHRSPSQYNACTRSHRQHASCPQHCNPAAASSRWLLPRQSPPEPRSIILNCRVLPQRPERQGSCPSPSAAASLYVLLTISSHQQHSRRQPNTYRRDCRLPARPRSRLPVVLNPGFQSQCRLSSLPMPPSPRLH